MAGLPIVQIEPSSASITPNPSLVTFNCELCTIKNYSCRYCEFTSSLLIILRKHIKGFHENVKCVFYFKNYECKGCNFQTNSLIVWVLHKRNSCLQRPQNVQHFKSFVCEKCKFRSYTDNIRVCILCHHRNKYIWFGCSHCDYKTTTNMTLQSHILNKHTNGGQINWFECGQCSYKGKKKIELKRHIHRRHTKEDEIQWRKCQLCPYKSITNFELDVHIRNRHLKKNHSEPKTSDTKVTWFGCQFCGYSTKRRHSLVQHVSRMHHSELGLCKRN